MADIVNLRRVRKTRARDDARREAGENAARHGLKKGEKALKAKREDNARRHLDGHRMETDE